jgi:thiol-disulfide isomerase/thioredoxin
MRYLVFFICLVFWSCREDKEVSHLSRIEGKILSVPEGINLVVLKRIGLKGPEMVDSAVIKDGQFSLAVPADSDYLYRLQIGREFLPLFMEEGEHQLEADYQRLYESARYSNSPLTSQMRRVETMRLGFEAKVAPIQQAFERAMYAGNQAGQDSAEKAFGLLQEQSLKQVMHLIDSMGPGPVAYLATSMLTIEEHFPFLDSTCVRFEREKPGRIYTQKLKAFLEIPRRLAIGKMAPDFQLPNPAGTNVSLASFKGKWVLLDFWASWCKPCRAENPLLVQLAKKYGSRGIQFFSVSLDEDRSAWMKAVVADDLNWAHASDLKGWENAAARIYGVNAVPCNYLIDPQGKIAARNLHGEALEEKLFEIFH